MATGRTLVTVGAVGVLVTTTLLAGHSASADSKPDPGAQEPLRLSAPSGDPLEGTNSWRLRRPAVSGQIEGYPSAVSGLPGEPVELSVSTIDPWFTVKAYRFGDYSGGAAHLVGTTGNVAGVRQPPPVLNPYETRTVRANWPITVSLATGGWRPGVYLLKLTSSTGFDSYVPYIVRSASTTGTVALVLPVTTWQAYNDWGGYSLYVGANGDRRSWAVSFDRPYARPTGSAGFAFNTKSMVMLAERTDLPISYLANTDVSVDPGVLDGAKAYVSVGHDEYWTHQMRDAVVDARDAGTNLAFLGANTMYWRIRLEGTYKQAARVVVGYKHDWRQDPMLATDPALVTGRWRDYPVPAPENAVTGMQYECFPVDTDYRVATPGWWGFRKTGVQSGTSFPRLVGIEADRVYPISSTPRPLQILSHKTYSCRGVMTSTQSTYYTTPSGAGVFNAGTLRWVCAIYQRCGGAALPNSTNDFVRRVTRNVLSVFSEGPAGMQYPAHDNVANFSLPTENEVPAS